MEVFEHFARRLAFLIGTHHNRRAVRVGTADHDDAIALQTLIARKNIGRQISARHVADMQVAVGIGPGNAN